MTDIFINGEIGGDSWDGQGEFGIIGSKFIQNQLAESDEDITVHINSPGGEVREGYAIHDLLINSGKKCDTIIEGNCSSIATVPFLAGESRTITENSTFMIHNPWTMSIGDADQIQEDVDRLKEVEGELLDFYVKKTGAKREELEALMAEEKELTAEQALDLGFATAIAETIKGLKKPNKIFAKAYCNRNMKKDKENKTVQAMLTSFTDKVMNLIKSGKHDDDEDKDKKKSVKTDPTPRAEEQQLADGTRIFINGDEGNFGGAEVFLISEDGSISPDNLLPDGDHPLGDGRVLRIEGGTITEVTEQMEEAPADPNALKAQVGRLEAEIKRMKQDTISKGMETEMLAELKNIKRSITSDGTPVPGQGNFEDQQEGTPRGRKSKVFQRAHKKWDKSKPTIKN